MAGYKLAIKPQDLIIQTAMFAIGSTLLHSAGCVINDICDKDFDAQVGETCPGSPFSGPNAMDLRAHKKSPASNWQGFNCWGMDTSLYAPPA